MLPQHVPNYAGEAHVSNYAGEDGAKIWANARDPGHMHGRGPEYLYIYIGLNQWQHSGTSQIHSRQVTANATVETAVVDAPSLT